MPHKNKYDTSFGSPYDRGVSNRYHGHDSDPHCYRNVNNQWIRCDIESLTEEEIKAYNAGYNAP
jgi:hypothetical protein